MFCRTALVVLLAAAVRAEDSSLDDCFKQGSVDCVRGYVSRRVRSFLGEESADFLEEVILKKDDSGEGSAVSDKSESVKSLSTEDPGGRGDVTVMDSGLVGSGTSWSRSFSSGLSEDKENVVSAVTVEGRGKKMKKILEYLIALKMLYFIWGMVGYVLVALVAKTALLKSSLALGLAGVFLLKKLLMHSYHHVLTRHGAGVQHEPPVVTNYGPPMGYAHADQHGGSVPYGAHHPDRRR